MLNYNGYAVKYLEERLMEKLVISGAFLKSLNQAKELEIKFG